MLTRWQRLLKPELAHPCLFVYVTSVPTLGSFQQMGFISATSHECVHRAGLHLLGALTSRLLTAPSEMAPRLGQRSIPAEVLKSINLLKCFKMYISKEWLVGPQLQFRGRCPCSQPEVM